MGGGLLRWDGDAMDRWLVREMRLGLGFKVGQTEETIEWRVRERMKQGVGCFVLHSTGWVIVAKVVVRAIVGDLRISVGGGESTRENTPSCVCLRSGSKRRDR